MKPVKIVLRRGGRMREDDGGVSLTKMQSNHTQKCHNETLLYN